MDNFDTEKLIQEIENRPALWNNTIEEYGNREFKKQCWNEIVDIFGGEDLTAAARKDMELTLQKKWKGIRGCFTRELKRQQKLRGGDSPGPRKSEYTYFQQLQFLHNLGTSRDSDDTPDYLYYGVPELTSVKVEHLEDPLNEDDLRSNKRFKPDDDEDRLFLLSMLSTLKRIPVSKKLSTKIKLMAVLEEATRD